MKLIALLMIATSLIAVYNINDKGVRDMILAIIGVVLAFGGIIVLVLKFCGII